MAGRNIMASLTDVKTTTPRNAVDLSRLETFTTRAGLLLPVFCEETLPGDYFEINSSHFFRTMPLNTAAFMRSKIHFEAYWVPTYCLWHRFREFISQRSDPDSASFSHLSKYAPSFTSRELAQALASQYQDNDDIIMNPFMSCQILDMLGYGRYYECLGLSDFNSYDNLKLLSAFPLLAYQKIWNDYYRNPWHDIPNANTSSLPYNVDDVVGADAAASRITRARDSIWSILAPRYRQYRKDLYMGLLPTASYDGVSSVSVLPDATANSTGSFLLYQNGSLGLLDQFGLFGSNTSGGTNSNRFFGARYQDSVATSVGFDVLALKRAEALQDWKYKTLRAGYRASSQQEAHFGVKPTVYGKEHPELLSAWSEDLTVDEVVSTAETSEASLGALAGKSVSGGRGRTVKFKSQDYGYLMILMSVEPLCEYDAVGVSDTLKRSEPFDWYTPEFGNLGLVPVDSGSISRTGSDTDYYMVLGYAPSYYEYKTRVDKVHDNFVSSYSGASRSSLSSWVITRRDLSSSIYDGSTFSISDFYISPQITDSVFVDNISTDINSNPFLCRVAWDVKAVRPMPILGLPQF